MVALRCREVRAVRSIAQDERSDRHPAPPCVRLEEIAADEAPAMRCTALTHTGIPRIELPAALRVAGPHLLVPGVGRSVEPPGRLIRREEKERAHRPRVALRDNAVDPQVAG